MTSGELTVSGKGETSIPLQGVPHHVEVHFLPDHEHVPCNPHHHDKLHYEVTHQDENPRHHHDKPHRHHDRQFFLRIEWAVSGVRTIRWFVRY